MACKENQKIPLAPPRNEYPRSHEERSAAGVERKRSSKCLVYVLVTAVTLGAALLIFALIFLRATTPRLQLQSVTVTYLSHADGGFNVTLGTRLRIDNENYGHFEFQNCSGVILYGSVTVGDVKIRDGLVGARETKRINATVEVRSSANLDDGYKNWTRVLKLNSYAKLYGKVTLLNVVKKTRTPELDCSMNLVFTTKAIEDLVCT